MWNVGAGAQAGWHTIAGMPDKVSAGGSIIYANTDGFLYIDGHSSRVPPVGNYVYRTALDNPGNPVEITGKGLPSDEAVDTLGQMADGTVLVSCHGVNAAGKLTGVGDVFWWNGSTTASVWKRIAGFDGRVAQIINLFSTDAAGYTYFSPEWTGDIWRNNSPNSKSFSVFVRSLYASTNGGSAGHATTGGLYEYFAWDLGDGRDTMLWAGGEGELDAVSLGGKKTGNLKFATTEGGYRGNMAGLAKGPNYVLFLRVNNTSPGTDYLHRIDIKTKTVSEPLQGFPRPEHGFPTHLLNVYNGLKNVSGKTFIFSGKDSHTGRDYPTPGPTYLLLSKDEGATWEDLTVGQDAGCTGTNLGLAASVVSRSRYVWVRCQGGRRIDYYGPLD